MAVEDVQLELALVEIFDVLSEQDVEHRAAQCLHRRARGGWAKAIRAALGLQRVVDTPPDARVLRRA